MADRGRGWGLGVRDWVLGVNMAELDVVEARRVSAVVGGGGNLVLLNPTASVMEVFKLLGLDHVFNISQDRNTAMAVFTL